MQRRQTDKYFWWFFLLGLCTYYVAFCFFNFSFSCRQGKHREKPLQKWVRKLKLHLILWDFISSTLFNLQIHLMCQMLRT